MTGEIVAGGWTEPSLEERLAAAGEIADRGSRQPMSDAKHAEREDDWTGQMGDPLHRHLPISITASVPTQNDDRFDATGTFDVTAHSCTLRRDI